VIADAPIIERITRVAPLGVLFWDAATARAVSDGLVVTYPAAGSDRPRRSVANGSHVFPMQDFPGLRETEQGAGDEAFWAAPPVQRAYRIDVEDQLGRFHPFHFRADLPARDLFVEHCSSPPGSPPAGVEALPLFATPGRPTPPATAAVRAQLWDVHADAPAAWARLDVGAAGRRLASGVADARGQVLVLFPYPELQPSFALSPTSPRGRFSDQTWELELAVFYPSVGAPPTSPGERRDLCDFLNQHPAALLDRLSPAVPLTRTRLAFGRALDLRTVGASVLFVSTSLSPP
jgi:hypothetical protein